MPTAESRRRRGGGLRPAVPPRPLLADQPPGLVVLGHHVAAGDVEDELGVTAAVVGAEARDQRPAAVLAAPGVPVHRLGVDVVGAQPLGHGVTEDARGALAGARRTEARWARSAMWARSASTGVA